MDNVLAEPPKYLRAPISRGGQPRVDRAGGYREAGIIRGVSVITKGEALGHGLWIDDVTLEQAESLINYRRYGIKSRFTHPSMSGDGLGKHVARVMDASIEGDQVFADQHFLGSAHKAPDGDLAEYLMSLAEEDPESYGLSIAFSHDADAMDQFSLEHTVDGQFRSPDPLNLNNYPHVRINDLTAADSVDEPAANPGGLFKRPRDIAQEADALAAYALGLSADRPNTNQLGLDPSRARGFVSRFLLNHKLEIRKMTEELEAVEATTAEPITEQPAEQTPESTEPATESTESAMNGREEAAVFVAKFGNKGAVWYAEGLSFDEARDRQVADLQAEIGELKAKLAARPITGEESPVSFDAADKQTRNGFASKIRIK
jgi:hypothetical protein